MGPLDLERLRRTTPNHAPVIPSWLRRRITWPAWPVACDRCGAAIGRLGEQIVHLPSDSQLSQLPDTVSP